jgi:hypothetical protein
MSNGPDDFTITFKRGDALMLSRAMMLYANSAMFEQRDGAEARLREYQEKFLEFSPDAAKHFSGYAWCEMAMAMENAESFSVDLSPGSDRGWWREGYIYISLKLRDGTARRYRSTNFHHQRGTDQVEATYDAIMELAPLGVTGTFDRADPPSYLRSSP